MDIGANSVLSERVLHVSELRGLADALAAERDACEPGAKREAIAQLRLDFLGAWLRATRAGEPVTDAR